MREGPVRRLGFRIQVQVLQVLGLLGWADDPIGHTGQPWLPGSKPAMQRKCKYGSISIMCAVLERWIIIS